MTYTEKETWFLGVNIRAKSHISLSETRFLRKLYQGILDFSLNII